MKKKLLSWSAISTFYTCPQLYHLQYELGYTPTQQSKALLMGDLAHRYNEALYKQDSTTLSLILQQADKDLLLLLNKIEELHSLINQQFQNSVLVEQCFALSYTPNLYLLVKPDFVFPSHNLFGDLKTSSQPTRILKYYFHSSQMWFYNYILSQIFQKELNVELYCISTKGELFRELIYFDKLQIRRVQLLLDQILPHILENFVLQNPTSCISVYGECPFLMYCEGRSTLEQLVEFGVIKQLQNPYSYLGEQVNVKVGKEIVLTSFEELLNGGLDE